MTAPMPGPLPVFERPPIQELVLSVQFVPLAGLRTAHVGLFWTEIRDRFPITQDQVPLPHVIEEFGPRPTFRVGLEVTTSDAPPVPRCWFLNEAGSQLVQVQQDRIIHNWRKLDADNAYPRYGPLRDAFRQELERFDRFVQRERIGALVPDQCEVTYVDQLVTGEGWERHGQLERVLTVWSATYSDSFLPEPESVQVAARYVIPGVDGAPAGRLYINTEPAQRRGDNTPVLLVRTTARGRPVGEGVEGALRFLDLGHEWAVRGFVSVTTPQMHDLWKRLETSR